jgi:hypothetical protein
MNTDGTLVLPPTWTGASVGSAAFALSRLIRVHLRFHFLAPGGTQAAGFAKECQAEKSGQDGSMRRRIICVALAERSIKSAGHRDSIENSSRLVVIS